MVILIFNLTYLGHGCSGVINHRPYVYDFETIRKAFNWLRTRIKEEVPTIYKDNLITLSTASISLICRSEYSNETHLIETHLFNIKEYRKVLYNMYGEEKANNIINMLKEKFNEKVQN